MNPAPYITDQKADPGLMPDDENTVVLFTTSVSDGNDNVTGVEVDLSSLGGSANQAMYDDGTNGDATADDDIYSIEYTVPSGLAAGGRSLTVTATDGDSQTDQQDITFTVCDINTPLIIDNPEAVWRGNWEHGTTSEDFSDDTCWSAAGTGTDTITWTFSVPFAQSYDVYAWWSRHANRASDAPYTISHSGGSDTVEVNQQVKGGQWNYLGTYSFAKGVYDVVLTDDANGYVVGDAIMFVPDSFSYPWPISDNLDADFTSGWEYPGTPAPGDQYATDFYYSVEGTGADIATWTLSVPTTGTYSVYAMWPDSTYYARNAPFTINHAGGPDTVRMSQEIKGGKWNWLGTYTFNAGNNTVVLTDDADDIVIADAIKFEAGAHSPTASYPIVDNPDADFKGQWIYPGTPAPGDQYATDFYYSIEGTGADTATWTIDVPTTGTYSVYAWWPDNATYYAIDAPYTISHAGGSDMVIMSQKIQGGRWNWLGTYTFNAGNNTVVLTDDAADAVIADAIKFEAGAHSPTASYPIVDNPDADFFGEWYEPASADDKYGADVYYSVKGTGADTATWTVDVPTTGTYSVYAWWCQGTNRATNAPYTINHAGGADTVTVSQEIKGGMWNWLGTYTFNAGNNTVVASDNANEYVFADAIKFEPGAHSPVTVWPIGDNPDAEYIGQWHLIGASEPNQYGSDFYYHSSGTGANTATWYFDVPVAGNYNVYAWWDEGLNRATDAPYTVEYEGGTGREYDTVDVNQKLNGGQWNLLGTYYFDAGVYSVVLSDDANEYVMADAVKFEPI